ncbi:MAG: succinate dehydrogenase, cytochrome b556 subunit [Chloroflexota bacterium]
MASLVLTIKETLRYRGALGQWSWVLHRLTGLGVVFFLILHVIDTAWAVTSPASYVKAIAAYQSPLFTIGEFGLVFAVVYHALNGLRISVMDFKPEWWKYQQRAAVWVLVGTAVILVPVFIGMGSHVLHHYEGDPFIMPFGEVIAEQLVFIPYFIGGAIAAGTIAFGWSALRINVEDDKGTVGIGKSTKTMRRIEKFWWSFMRISGVLIIPLVFGHLAMMHVLQGVFDITLADGAVVGTAQIEDISAADIAAFQESTTDANIYMENAPLAAEGLPTGTVIVPNGINETGTAVEFVAERWNFLVNGVAVWKFYDMALLILVVMHGFNGLRLVLTDYTMDNRFARSFVIAISVVGALGLLFVGLQSLWLSIDNEAINMAVEATRTLYEIE